MDQFVYCVIWATPVTALFYGWKEAGYSFRRWKQEQSARVFLDKVIIFTITTWMVWTPATAIIYSLPSALQIPLFNLTLCFFVLLVSVYGKR
jgi:membrane protein required for beta-lactamase induction